MRNCLLFTLILGLTCSTTLFAQAPVSIVGDYVCRGNDPTLSPSAYVGNIIIKKNGSVYTLNENEPSVDGSAAYFYYQVALRHDNILAMAFQQSTNPKIFGTEIMTISKDGKTLHGTFTYFDIPNKIGKEVCTRKP